MGPMDEPPGEAGNDAMKCIAIFTTVGTLAQAQSMARAIVERKLAACAQISAIESFYTWDGAVRHEPEFRILFKTTDRRYRDVQAAIRKLHPYELPAIHAVAFDQVFGPYAAWIESNCVGASESAGSA